MNNRSVSTIDGLGKPLVMILPEKCEIIIGSNLDLDVNIDDQIFEEMNRIRLDRKLKPFVKHSTLHKAATSHALWMAQTGNHSHYGPTRNNHWANRCAAAGYPGANLTNIGENVGMGQRDANQIVGDWMRSSGHARQILSTQNRHVGSGMGISSKGIKFWCTDFAYGAPDETEIEIEKLGREAFSFI